MIKYKHIVAFTKFLHRNFSTNGNCADSYNLLDSNHHKFIAEPLYLCFDFDKFLRALHIFEEQYSNFCSKTQIHNLPHKTKFSGVKRVRFQVLVFAIFTYRKTLFFELNYIRIQDG